MSIDEKNIARNLGTLFAAMALPFASHTGQSVKKPDLSQTHISAQAEKRISYSYSGGGSPSARASSPTVVFQSGLGDDARVWTDVLAALGEHVPAFTYDRPGYGKSPATSLPRTPCDIAEEQHQLLKRAGVKAPYILVGHSLGGLYEYAYARLYPQEVAGLLLVEATHPNLMTQMEKDVPAIAYVLKKASNVFPSSMSSEFDAQAKCLAKIDASQPLQNKTIVMLRSEFSGIEAGAFANMMRDLAQDWTKLTGAPQVEYVSGTGHNIQKDRPAVVADAIRRLRQP